MKGIILFMGKYGATRQYAEWLGNELHLPVTSLSNFPEDTISDYDCLVILSSVYIGKMLIRDWLKKNEAVLRHKMVFFGIVCMTPDSAIEEQNEIISRNIPSFLNHPSKTFFLLGRLEKRKLSLRDRFMLWIGSLLEKDPIRKHTMKTDIDWVSRDNISNLVKMVRKCISQRTGAYDKDHCVSCQSS